MKLHKVYLSDSPQSKDKVRLNGEVTYDSCKGEIYWFDFPREFESDISLSGNAWLTCLLPLAMHMGESLIIPQPVDQTRFANAIELRNIWVTWYSRLHKIDIHAESRQASLEPEPNKTAAFFSGGVDSFFTILRNEKGSEIATNNQINDLLSIWGTDIPLTNASAFDEMKQSLVEAAKALDKEFIDIGTNACQTRLNSAGWSKLYFSSLYIAIGLLLEKRYCKLLFSGSGEVYNTFEPWGSHPITDPLLSSSSMQVIHDGAGFDRVERTKFIAKNELVRKKLRVCWRQKSAVNCCNCEKCYRTMITLYLLDELDNFNVFPHRLDLTKLSKIYLPNQIIQDLYGQIIHLAHEKGRGDIVRRIKQSFQASNLVQVFSFLRSMRYFWRWEAALRKLILRDYLV